MVEHLAQRRSSLMPAIIEGRLVCLPVLVLAVLCLVHEGTGFALERHAAAEEAIAPVRVMVRKKLPKPGEDTGPLPEPVEEMRQAILAASHSGNIEDLRVPLDWKETSGDGNGREILAVLADILPMRAAELPFGQDLENNIIYVWPYLAEVELDKLTPAQEVDLLRLVGPAEAKAMREKKKWTWWRLTIGADGTWHSFKKAD